MHIFARFSLAALFAISLVAPQVSLGAPTCESLFKKEGFIAPSVRITATGWIEAKLTNSESVVGRFLNSLTRLVYKPLSLDNVEQVTQRLMADTRPDVPFWEKLSDAFGLEIQIDPRMLERIPRTGGLIVVGNHVANGVDGVVLAAVVSKVRPDVKVVLTQLLGVIPTMAENSVFISPYLGPEARAYNIAGIEKMVEHVKDGHALVVFPTGESATKAKPFDEGVIEARWRKGVAHILSRVPEAAVQPIFVEGQASSLYLWVSYFTKKIPVKYESLQSGINAGFHVREIGNRLGTNMNLVIGEPISGAEINGWKDPAKRASAAMVMNRLRDRTLALRPSGPETSTARVPLRSVPRPEVAGPKERPQRRVEAIAEPMDMAVVAAELKARARVIYDMAPEAETKRMKVFLARGRDIPETMKEIGRLREIAFRLVGEGSGRSRDLDGFDPFYEHLIVVDKKSGQIAGAYRIGRVDEILRNQGSEGIYTGLFFDHSKLINTYLKDSLELGRSFVVPEFQRSFALPALFGAIGRFVVENPRYKDLRGPVSISSEVTERSQGIMIAYLQKYHESPDAHLVRPLTPLKRDFVLSDEDVAFINSKPSMKDLSMYVEQIEKIAGTQNLFPQLIPIYVGLGAKFFKFNIDADFNTLDGLIVTDLSKLTVEILKPYMGEEGAKVFLDYHSQQPR